MKIDPERLSKLRETKHMTRLDLAKRSGISERTIQRLENESHRCRKTQEHTLNRLAKALSVEQGILTGELPFTQSNKTPTSDPERVHIGAQIAPKARLAYDLIKRRYGVSATEIINMAPLFFTLLAEGSLAWRREKLQDAEEAKSCLEETDGFWRGSLGSGLVVMEEGIKSEADSIDKADLFGEQLFEDSNGWVVEPFDPSVDNPFASHLRKLVEDLKIPDLDIVDEDLKISDIPYVKDGDLDIGSSLKFPYYDICRAELDRIANGSDDARMALETGHVRVSQIPGELMAEDAGEEREKWLKDKLPNFYNKLSDEDRKFFGELVAKDPSEKLKNILEKAESQKTDSTEEGDDQ